MSASAPTCIPYPLRIADPLRVQNAEAQEIEVGPPEHLAFNHFQPVDLPLELAIVDRQSQASQHSGEVREQSLGKATQWPNPTRLGFSNPVAEFLPVPLMDYGEECVCQGCCLGELCIELGEQLEVDGFLLAPVRTLGESGGRPPAGQRGHEDS